MKIKQDFEEAELQLIETLSASPPDFGKAKDLIQGGADINAAVRIKQSQAKTSVNILSAVLDKRMSLKGDETEGDTLIQVTRFFLDNGFDVSKKSGRISAGETVLRTLIQPPMKNYPGQVSSICEMLYDAGLVDAINSDRRINLVADIMEMMCAASDAGDLKYACSLDACWSMAALLMMSGDKDYQHAGIYLTAIGKQIQRIVTNPEEECRDMTVTVKDGSETAVFRNCYSAEVQIVFQDGVLEIKAPGPLHWDDEEKPECADISGRFPGLCGKTVTGFDFLGKDAGPFGYPAALIHLDDGSSLRVVCVRDRKVTRCSIELQP